MSPLSGVLGEAWATYRRHFQHFILISFVIYLGVAVVSALLSWGLGRLGTAIGGIFFLFGMFLLQAALVKAVQDVRDGRVDLDLKATLEAALPSVGKVAVAAIVASIAIAIGFVLLIVPGLILLTFWALIVPWIVLGGAAAFESFGRSWNTVKGYAWNVFGTFVLVFLILIAFGIILSVVLLALPPGWRNFVSSVVSGTLVAPFTAAVVTLIYYRLTAAHGEAAEPGMPTGAPGYGGPGYGAPGDPGYGQPGGYDQPGGYPPPGGYAPPPGGAEPPGGYGPPPAGGYQPPGANSGPGPGAGGGEGSRPPGPA
jgi:hypothetical protein